MASIVPSMTQEVMAIGARIGPEGHLLVSQTETS